MVLPFFFPGKHGIISAPRPCSLDKTPLRSGTASGRGAAVANSHIFIVNNGEYLLLNICAK
jgi:hypothetical protein